jgi:hypothetical protein
MALSLLQNTRHLTRYAANYMWIGRSLHNKPVQTAPGGDSLSVGSGLSVGAAQHLGFKVRSQFQVETTL